MAGASLRRKSALPAECPPSLPHPPPYSLHPLPFFISTVLLLLLLFSNGLSGNGKVEVGEEKGTKWSGICELPLSVGNCSRQFKRFHFDPAKRQCFKFVYSGCGGNANRFLTRHQCKRRCHPNFRHRKNEKSRLSATLRTTPFFEREHLQIACAEKCANGICTHNGICKCKHGFELGRDKHCVDSNECHWINCAENALCVNLPGSFRCECRSGLAGSGYNCTKNRRICGQWFDHRYEGQCQPEQGWTPRFYYHIHSGQCRQFWYGGCQFGDSQNFFMDKKSCVEICGNYSHSEFFADLNVPSEQNEVPNKTGMDPKSDTKIADGTAMDLKSPCMDPFDESLRKPCSENIWKRRYYFDATVGQCRVFWMDVSCSRKGPNQRRSRNIFEHLPNCKRICEGNVAVESGGKKDESWDEWEHLKLGGNGVGRTTGVIQASFAKNQQLAERAGAIAPTAVPLRSVPLGDDCALVRISDQLAHANSVQEKRERMARLKKKLGRQSAWAEKHKQFQKQKAGIHNGRGRHGQSDICFDAFDRTLTNICDKGPWRLRFFYDTRHDECRPFWSDGCESSQTRNNFYDEGTCRRKCEVGEKWPNNAMHGRESWTEIGALACAQPFDPNYRRACNNGRRWKRKWFFDLENGFCRHFWYDGCVGKSTNIFDGLKECMDQCVLDNGFPRANFLNFNETEDIGRKFVYLAEGQELAMDFRAATPKNYLKSAHILLNESQCIGFRYSSIGSACLSAFLCLMEEGGGCQRMVHWATNGDEQCHLQRPWMVGVHAYAWFFTLERRPSSLPFPSPLMPLAIVNLPQQQKTASAVLTLLQPHLNTTKTAHLAIEPFGQHNETVASVELIIPENCNC